MASTTIYVKNELSSEIELNGTLTHNWHGQISGNQLWAVQPGKEGNFVHKGDSTASGGGVVYRVRNKEGHERDWVIAWETTINSTTKKAESSIYTSIDAETWNSETIDWKTIHSKLVSNTTLVTTANGLQATVSVEASANASTVKATISYYTDTAVVATLKIKNELSTEIELNDTISQNWLGQASNKLWAVQPGKVGQFEHKGKTGSSAGVVYRARSKDGKEWDWVIAWDVQTERKINTAILDETWNKGQIKWDDIKKGLVAKDELVVEDHGLRSKLTAAAGDAAGSTIITATISYAA